MDLPGKQLLPGACFTDQQHIGIRCCHFANRFQQVLKDLTAARDLIKSFGAIQVLPQLLVFTVEFLKLKQTLQATHQLVKVDRLHQIVEGPCRERFHRVFNGGVGRNDEHEHGRIDAMQASQQLDTVAIRQLNIADSHIKITLADHGQGFFHGPGRRHPESFPGHEFGQRVPNDLFVFNNQNRFLTQCRIRHLVHLLFTQSDCGADPRSSPPLLMGVQPSPQAWTGTRGHTVGINSREWGAESSTA